MRGLLVAGLGPVALLGLGLWGAVAQDGVDANPGPYRMSYADWQLEQERERADDAEVQVMLLEIKVKRLERELLRAHTVNLHQEEAFQQWLQVLSNISPELEPVAVAAAEDVGLLEPGQGP